MPRSPPPDKARQAAYRHLFRSHLDEEMVSELRLAVNQNQSLGNERFYETIERMAGQRREARPRGRPRLSGNVANEDVKGQGDLGL
jgi:putative transposase